MEKRFFKFLSILSLGISVLVISNTTSSSLMQPTILGTETAPGDDLDLQGFCDLNWSRCQSAIARARKWLDKPFPLAQAYHHGIIATRHFPSRKPSNSAVSSLDISAESLMGLR